MVDEVTEKPTLEGPKPDEGTESTPEQQAASMLQTLESLGIKDEEHIKGVVQTAQKFGPQAQELGELRQLVNEMKQERTSQEVRPPQQPVDDVYDTGENVDLAKLIYQNQYKATRDFYKKEIVAPQQQMQRRYFAELNEVQGDEDYNLVEKVFTEHLNSPQLQSRLASGQTSVSKEYDKTVRSMYRNYLKQTKDALQGVVKPGDITVPHVESQTQQPVMPTTDEEAKELTNKIVEARKAGNVTSDQAVDLMLKAGLKPDPNDPFFQMGNG
jgi:hypothetical protein